jgi:hypothetical protein
MQASPSKSWFATPPSLQSLWAARMAPTRVRRRFHGTAKGIIVVGAAGNGNYKLENATALFVFMRFFFVGAGAASACTPVAYLFRHAEDENQAKSGPYDLTLSTSGVAHADLYIEMMRNFHQEKLGKYCPIREIYALNPIKSDGSWGTSNPYWTANPLAQTAETTMEDRNAIISVQGLNLTEFLDHGEGSKIPRRDQRQAQQPTIGSHFLDKSRNM